MKAPTQTLCDTLLLSGTLLFGVFTWTAAGQEAPQPLTSVASVRGLPAAEAEALHPVKLRGVVTFFDANLYSRFIQDDSAGIYLLENTNLPPLSPGQLVEVDGVTGPGEYAPVVQPTRFTVLGEAPLPAARKVSPEELVTGRHDGQLVELTDVVRSAYFDNGLEYYGLEFGRGNERFTVYSKSLPVGIPSELVAATVTVRGVCATLFNSQRQLFGVRLLASAPDAVVVDAPAAVKPFDLEPREINSLLRFAPEGPSGRRVKITGTVTAFEPGSSLFIQDESSGVYCQTHGREPLLPGDRVEVVGFPAPGEYTPILEDAIYRKVGAHTEPGVVEVVVNQVLTGSYDSRLVRLKARLLDRVDRGLHQFLLLQSGHYTFHAQLPRRADMAEFALLEPGSDIEVTGVCMIERGSQWEAGSHWRARGFQLLLRSPEDVVVLASPSTFEVGENTPILVGVGIISIGLLGWVVVLRRRLHAVTQRNQRN